MEFQSSSAAMLRNGCEQDGEMNPSHNAAFDYALSEVHMATAANETTGSFALGVSISNTTAHDGNC